MNVFDFIASDVTLEGPGDPIVAATDDSVVGLICGTTIFSCFCGDSSDGTVTERKKSSPSLLSPNRLSLVDKSC